MRNPNTCSSQFYSILMVLRFNCTVNPHPSISTTSTKWNLKPINNKLRNLVKDKCLPLTTHPTVLEVLIEIERRIDLHPEMYKIKWKPFPNDWDFNLRLNGEQPSYPPPLYKFFLIESFCCFKPKDQNLLFCFSEKGGAKKNSTLKSWNGTKTPTRDLVQGTVVCQTAF